MVVFGYDDIGKRGDRCLFMGVEILLAGKSLVACHLEVLAAGRIDGLRGGGARCIGRRMAGAPSQNGTRRYGPKCFQTLSPVHGFCFFRWSMMYSAVRMESARMVQVGFFSDCCVKIDPSVTKRFLQSCDCPYLFRADF